MTNPKSKRKATAFIEEPTEEEADVAGSDYESDQENLLGSIANDEADASDSEGEVATESEGEDDENFISLKSSKNAGDDESNEDSDDESVDYEDVSSGAEEEVEQDSDDSDFVNDNSGEDFHSSGADDDEEVEQPPKEKRVVPKKKKEKLPKQDKKLKSNEASTSKESPALLAMNKELGNVGLKDEFADGDTSDEEDIRNTVGNIPMHWYDDYKHIGYDWDAKKIIKPPVKDTLDNFLDQMDDPNFWRTVKDPQTGQDVILTPEDVALIRRIMSQRNPDNKFEEYAPWVEWFTSEAEKLPIRNIPDHKRSFLPSKGEKLKIGRLTHAFKMGWAKTIEEERRLRKAKNEVKFYMLWETDHGREQMRRIHDHVTAPKRALPGHAESYNPPSEYLFDEKEMQDWNKMAATPHKRKLHFMPQKYKSLREVPYYDRYIKERFLRCLDLYLCPRGKRMRVTVQPEDLIPKLPSSKDLQPFPSVQSLIYRGHTNIIRTISVEPRGQFIVTGSDDQTVKVWEISTARCVKTVHTQDVVRSVAWCPNAKLSLIAIASGQRVLLMNPKVGDKLLIKKTDDILMEAPKTDLNDDERIKVAVEWQPPTRELYDEGVRIVLQHFKEVKQVSWHGKGDYFASVMPEGANRSVVIHQLSKRRSQIPFSRSKGLIQCVLFHPVKPCIFVATQRHIRIYDLVKQDLVKKLLPNCKWISDIAIHPKGDNLLVATYDKKMQWFDLDLSTKPYQTLKLHAKAVRGVAFHQRYPLFASASDDRGVIISHGMVYNDLLQNPLIVPLKRLEYHDHHEDFGAFGVVFHPTQPWLFSTGADNTVRLYT